MYDHTQKGKTVIYALVSVYAVTMFLLLLSWIFLPSGTAVSYLIPACFLGVFLLVCGYLFSSLRVIVDERAILISFGPGIIKKMYKMEDVASAEVFKHMNWLYGWGIRYTPQGVLYNVSGFDGVKVTFRNGKSIIIGSDDVASLLDAIEGYMTHG